METNVGILAIGNEVVEGQITNRNASWLSQELSNLGAHPLYHMSCRDHNEEIRSSLNYLSQHCHLIITSGGLGPTKDDFTRQVLSRWSNAPLEFHESLWQQIKTKLTSRQVTLREGHKNQAYIPFGANILDNDNGIAPGFFLKAQNCFLASLPGPPTELKRMFELHLKPLILEKISPKTDQTLYTWICLGAPESEIAHIAESIIGQKFELGFRIHKPYVEVKLWGPKLLQENEHKILSLLKEKLKPWFVGHSIQTIRQEYHQHLAQYEKVFVIDHLSAGLYLEKMKENYSSKNIRYQCFEHESFRFFSKEEINEIIHNMPLTDSQFMISLFPASDSKAFLSIEKNIHEINLPRNIPIQSKLGQLYVIEHCFLKIIGAHV